MKELHDIVFGTETHRVTLTSEFSNSQEAHQIGVKMGFHEWNKKFQPLLSSKEYKEAMDNMHIFATRVF